MFAGSPFVAVVTLRYANALAAPTTADRTNIYIFLHALTILHLFYSPTNTSKMPSDACFTIKEVPGKGLGAFATRDVEPGDFILAEKPLLQIQNAHYLAEDVEAEFNKLTEEKKAVYMSLASAHGQDPSKYPTATSSEVTDKRERRRIHEQHEARIGEDKTVFSICMTNAMQVEEGAGIFEIASRFNHACVPNACFCWDEEKKVETIYAVHDIAQGEVRDFRTLFLGCANTRQEITLCYCDPFYDISMRKWELMHYGFECQCKACKNPDDPESFAHASRERRWKMRNLDAALRIAVSASEQLQVRLDLVGTMKAEGMCTPYMDFLYLEIARICAQGEDYVTAAKAAKKAQETYSICVGAENHRALKAGKSVRAFERQIPGGLKK